MKNRSVLLIPLVFIMVAGCSLSQPASKPIDSPKPTGPSQHTPQSNNLTFDEQLSAAQAQPLIGKTVADMIVPTDPALYHYAFVSPEDKPLFVYGESDGSTSLVVLKPDLSVDKISHFQNTTLNRAVLNNKILYFGYKMDRAFKFNTTSHDFSEVSKGEMDRTRAILDEDKLPGGEKTLLIKDGYLYTKEGVLFDPKAHDYLYEQGSSQQKRQFYQGADFAHGDYLFKVDPRQDRAFNLTLIKTDGEKTQTGKIYGIKLDLPVSYDVKQLEYTMRENGNLLIFAVGVQEAAKSVVKVFELPLGAYLKVASDTVK